MMTMAQEPITMKRGVMNPPGDEKASDGTGVSWQPDDGLMARSVRRSVRRYHRIPWTLP
jgi:hypothetical protein